MLNNCLIVVNVLAVNPRRRNIGKNNSPRFVERRLMDSQANLVIYDVSSKISEYKIDLNAFYGYK